MDIKNFLLKIPFFIFCFIMILLYYNGFIYPEETNYWIVTYGLPIIFLEILGLITFIFLVMIVEHKFYIGWPMIVLVLIILITFFFTFLFNISLFIYFLISVLIKFFALRKAKKVDEIDEKIGGFGVTSLSWLLAIFIGMIFSSIFNNIYPNQIHAIEQFVTERLPQGLEIVGNVSTGGMIVLAGISYFIFSIIFNLILIVLIDKKGQIYK